MSENTTKVIQFRGSEIDQIRKCASGASFCNSEKTLSDEEEEEERMKEVSIPERREPKPQMEM